MNALNVTGSNVPNIKIEYNTNNYITLINSIKPYQNSICTLSIWLTPYEHYSEKIRLSYIEVQLSQQFLIYVLMLIADSCVCQRVCLRHVTCIFSMHGI